LQFIQTFSGFFSDRREDQWRNVFSHGVHFHRLRQKKRNDGKEIKGKGTHEAFVKYIFKTLDFEPSKSNNNREISPKNLPFSASIICNLYLLP